MQKTICGFNQEKALEYGLDLTDLIILRYFIYCRDEKILKSEKIENEYYYFVNYDIANEDLPVLNLKKDSMYRRFKKLCDKEILKSIVIRKKEIYCSYTIAGNYYNLLKDIG